MEHLRELDANCINPHQALDPVEGERSDRLRLPKAADS
jgi:hypothetical protein